MRRDTWQPPQDHRWIGLFQNLWTRLAVETPIGAFRLLDCLILTSDNVGEAYRQFARYSRLVGAPMVVDIRDEEELLRQHISFVVPGAPCPEDFGPAW
jgi:hypothetical protein